MSEALAQSYINDIYSEGDIDLLFFGFITGFVNYDENDQCYGKSDLKCFQDTLTLIRYLVDEGDFSVGYMGEKDGQVGFIAYENDFKEFELAANTSMQNNGLHCDALLWGFAIRKMRIGKRAPSVREDIANLMRPPF